MGKAWVVTGERNSFLEANNYKRITLNSHLWAEKDRIGASCLKIGMQDTRILSPCLQKPENCFWCIFTPCLTWAQVYILMLKSFSHQNFPLIIYIHQSLSCRSPEKNDYLKKNKRCFDRKPWSTVVQVSRVVYWKQHLASSCMVTL